jgi:hypothetical protein
MPPARWQGIVSKRLGSVNVMPPQKAARLQISEKDRRRYIRITNEKTNNAPSGHGGWFRLASIELANGDNWMMIQMALVG